jgi:tetratricopeptide (TPR) repeat protein
VGLEERRVVRTAVPLAVGGDLYNLGSGYLIADKLVLTAAHVLEPAEGATVREGQEAEVARIGGEWQEATVAWVDAKKDVALLACPDLQADSMVRWGRLVGSKPLEWGAVGFPVASADDAAGRQPEHAFGRTSPISDLGAGRLALTIESREAKGGNSPWAGLSGAGVFCGDHFVGVVTTDPGAYATSLVGRRVMDFCDDPKLTQLLGGPVVPENVEGGARESGQHDSRGTRQAKVFLSHLTADITWAEWIAGVLGEAGFNVIRQRWLFVAGTDLAARAQESLKNECVMVLLSAAFIASPHSGSVWLRQLMAQEANYRRILLVRVEPCQLPDWLAPHIAVDFVRKPAASILTQLLEELAARGFIATKELAGASRTYFVRDFPGRGPVISNLPPRNEVFTNRIKVLGRIQRVLLAEPNAGRLQACALHGLGGIGKTQAVIEFAHRFGSHYDLIWWIRAEQNVSISDHLMWLARELHIDQATEQSRILASLWQELQRRDRWLLIFDNAPDPEALEPFWPPSGNGDILVTSRHTAWARLGGVSVRVRNFTATDAVTFLQKRSNKTGEREAALKVAEKLGFLPLALEQAAAYVEETHTSLRAYSKLLPANQQALLAVGRPRSYPGTVASTWKVSINAACAGEPHARDLLALFAYLAPDDIPRDLVPEHAEALRGPLAREAANPVSYNNILAALINFSLVDADPERIGIHRLVQLMVRADLDPAERVSSHSDAVRLLAAAFPADPADMRTWPICGRLLAHVTWVIQDYEQLLPHVGAELGALLQSSGRYLHVRGDFIEARRLLELALEVRRGQSGKDRTAEAETLTTLGRLYYHLAVLDPARRATEQALTIYREELGEDAPQTMDNMLHLSRILREIDEFAVAEHVAREFLRAYARSGANDPAKLSAGHSTLGDALWRLGQLNQARDSYREALRIRQSNTGVSPVDVAGCHKHIGIVSIELGDYDVAEQELRKARQLLATFYGDDNLDVIDVELHLGDSVCRAGRPDEAKTILKRVVQVRERILGAHPDLAGALVKYGTALNALGEYPEAIATLQRASEMFGQRSGRQHTYVGYAELALAEALCHAGQFERARAAAEQAHMIYTAAHGPGHPSAIQAQTLLDELSLRLSNQVASTGHRAKSRRGARPERLRLS